MASSKSDPFVVAYEVSEHGQGRRTELGRTEMIRNNHDPHFVTQVVVMWKFEEVQHMLFEVRVPLGLKPLADRF